MNFDDIINSAAQGDERSLEILAFMHESGRFPGGADPLKAAEIYERLSNPPFNNERAMMKLGKMYCTGKCLSGSIGKKDIAKGRSYIKRGYDNIDIENPLDISLCAELGMFIGQGEASESGKSKQEDIKMSIQFLKKALENEEAVKESAPDGKGESYLKTVKDYMDNRIELLANEESLKGSF